jgi:hypothetical protein
MRVTRMSGRLAIVLVGASVAAASVSLAGAQVVSAATTARLAVISTPHAGPLYSPSRGPLRARALLPAGATVDPSFSALSGVYCTAASNCWAVGERSRGSADVNEILHWKGSGWRNHAVPSPGGTAVNHVSQLFAVRCLTARSCWAVGEYQNGNGAIFSQALRWNGTKWSVVATPQPGGHHSGDVTELFDVTCTSSANCWAVGDYGNFTGNISNLVKLANETLRWNGTKWSRVTSPDPAGTATGRVNSLFGVRCISSTNCNAVGDYANGTDNTTAVMRNEALHWNGTKWSQAHTPNPGGSAAGHYSSLDAVGCVPSNCWAVGTYGVHTTATTTNSGEALHWNGKRWSRWGVPSRPGNSLIGVMCVTKSYCWAVGVYTVGLAYVNEAVHWNGSKWSEVTTPDPAGTATGEINTLISIRCVSRTSCWAVGLAGTETTGLHNEILHWNGSKWSVKPAPFA